MRVLVTGGAGYIGSHTVLRLALAGHWPVVVDDLSNGHQDAVLAGSFHRLDIRDTESLVELMEAERIEAVIHFAACIEAGLSVVEPQRFWSVNVGGTVSLTEAMSRVGVNKLVFSSTAAVFGNPTRVPVEEDDPRRPVNPYGETKLAVEHLLIGTASSRDLNFVALRYFNAAGADPQGQLGERHRHESHLIPLALAVAAGRQPRMMVFGNDYPTHDGTCVRDYVHVSDLAEAHVAALNYLADGGKSCALNLGTGRGYSVNEVIAAVETVTGRTIPTMLGKRRQGDPCILVAANARAVSTLGWQPRHADLEEIVAHAWAFHTAQWKKAAEPSASFVEKAHLQRVRQ